MGSILAEAAFHKQIPVSLYPTKGMAQRGGFVQAVLRLGRQGVGPGIPEKGADLVIAMEVSEALKAVRLIKPGNEFLLFGHIWTPTAVALDQADYPALDRVLVEVQAAAAKVLYVAPDTLPSYGGRPVPANIFVLGIAIGHTSLRHMLDPSAVAEVVEKRWTRGAERNLFAFEKGLAADVKRG
jgi:indolepyruvate ferredoxin oxidoreductase beta subunit